MMKKNGFTLQEALITVGIIGIVAAITVPALTKLLPNPYQTRYLKAYDAITTLTKEMLSNPDLYWYNSDGRGCDGLACDTVPARDSVPDALRALITNRGANNNPNQVQKYAAILAYNMQVPNENMAIFVAGVPGPSFITANGIAFFFSQTVDNDIQIDIDVDPNGPDLSISADSPLMDPSSELPDRYKFRVDRNGNVTPGDPLGMAYLDDPTRANNNKKDIIQLSNKKVNDNPGITWFKPMIDGRDKTLCERGFDIFCSHTKRTMDSSSIKDLGLGD